MTAHPGERLRDDTGPPGRAETAEAMTRATGRAVPAPSPQPTTIAAPDHRITRARGDLMNAPAARRTLAALAAAVVVGAAPLATVMTAWSPPALAAPGPDAANPALINPDANTELTIHKF